jgi:hypothetical protein
MLEFDINQPHFDGIDNKKSLRQRFSLVSILLEVSKENAHCRLMGFMMFAQVGLCRSCQGKLPRKASAAANF